MRIRSSGELETFLSSHNIYRYRYIDGPMIARYHVEQILDAMKRGARYIETTLDLGLSRAQIEIRDGKIAIGDLEVDIRELDEIVEEGFLYKLIGGSIVRMDMFRDGNYYKLKPVAIDKAPTIEINGVQMHRTIGADPWSDAREKVRTLGRVRGLRVLEIGTGLGYTASRLILSGALEVISIEKDLNVLQLASANPWSKMLEIPRIRIVVGDAYTLIKDLCSECFERILHDPPRISIAEELYSSEFYRELYRVLRSGGKLFHYTGEPGKHSNISYLKGIKRRLEEAGFYKVLWVDNAKGFLALKP
ncbi:MAG: hypothetical protein QXQ57_00725 [Sulfolobales archaeon]